MSLKDCVTSLLNSKQITKAVAEELDNEVTRILRQRNIDPSDVIRRAEVELEIVNRYSQAAKVRLLGAAREIKRLNENRAFMANHKISKSAGLADILENTHDSVNGILGNLAAPLTPWLTRMRTKVAGGFGGKNSAAGRALQDDLLRGLFGEEVSDSLVRQTLKAYKEVDARKVAMKQQTGIDVTALKNRIPHSWQRPKIVRNFKTAEEWSNFLLDEGATTSGEGGIPNPPALSQAIFKDMYEKIVTGGDNPSAFTLQWFKDNPDFKQQQSQALRELLPELESFSHLGREKLRKDTSGSAIERGKAIAKRGNKELGPKLGERLRSSQVRERVVEIPNAEAWKRIMRRAGNDSIHDSIMEDLAKDAQTIAVANAFGPNPNRVFRRLEAEAQLADKDRKGLTDVGQKFFTLKERYNTLTGQVDEPSNITAADVLQGIRTIVGAGLLSASSLPALSDQAFMRNVARNFGPGLGRLIKKQLKFYGQVFSTKKELEQAALRAGVSISHILQSGGAGGRFTDTGVVAGFSQAANRAMDFTLGSNGLNLMTRAAEWTLDLDIQNGTASALRKAMKESPNDLMEGVPKEIRAIMQEAGLQNKHLKKIVKAIEEDPQVGFVFKPEKITDVDTLAKFSGFKHQLIREGVPRPGLTGQVVQSGGYKRGTKAGEAWRMMSQLQGFPVSVFLNSMRIFAESSRYTGVSRFTALARLAAEGMVLGVIGLQLKQIGTGKSMYDWDNPDLWLSAMIISSPLGIMTDKLAGIPAEWNPFYDLTFRGSLLGPVGEFSSGLGRMGKAAINAEGQRTAYEGVSALEKATPGAFYMKLLFKHHIYNELKKIIDSKRFNKQMSRARKRLAPEQQFLIGDD